MKLVFFCQLVSVLGLSKSITDAYLANALGGGLYGAYLTSDLRGGSLYNNYIGASAISNPSTSSLYLLGGLGTNYGGSLGNTLNTYYAANAEASNPTQYTIAALSSNNPRGNIQNAYLANALGGGFLGSYLATDLSGNNNNHYGGGNGYYNGGYNGGYYNSWYY